MSSICSRGIDGRYHYVYRLELPDGRYYLGKHSTYDMDDGYVGYGLHSGKSRWSMRGIDSSLFSKSILSYHTTEEDAYKAESLIVTAEVIRDELCLNQCLGGISGNFKGILPWNHPIATEKSKRTWYNHEQILEISVYSSSVESLCSILNWEPSHKSVGLILSGNYDEEELRKWLGVVSYDKFELSEGRDKYRRWNPPWSNGNASDASKRCWYWYRSVYEWVQNNPHATISSTRDIFFADISVIRSIVVRVNEDNSYYLSQLDNWISNNPDMYDPFY